MNKTDRQNMKPKIKTDTTISDLYAFEQGKPVKCPLFVSKISAGFPSPADDFLDKNLDLNQHLIKHPAATFFVRVSGDSMTGAGINNNDILIVDRSLELADGKIIIAILNGELTVKRYRKINGESFLMAENPKYKPIEVGENKPFEVWGVVTSVIHKV